MLILPTRAFQPWAAFSSAVSLSFLQIVRGLLAPRVFAPIAAAIYVLVSVIVLLQALPDPKLRERFVSGDAKAYVGIAGDFAGGNFSMDYVKKQRPHRQPLYPAALAGVIRLLGQDYFWMAMVNVLCATLAFLALYAAILHFYGRPEIAAIVGILFLVNPFLFEQTTGHFMTEPLHILLMCGVIFPFLGYLESGRAWLLLTAVGMCGLDYLTRPNGLFVLFSLGGALAIYEAAQWARSRRLPSAKKLGLYAAAALLFVAVTTPSWLPRWQAFGDPIYHGYLTNYMWVDTYEQGHSWAKYTWRDYAASHTAGDAVGRAGRGIWNVGFSVPFRVEKFPALYLLALAGVVVAAIRGPASYRVLAIFGVLQLLPLMWTNLSNPNDRVPYFATMPFEFVFAAFFLAWIADRVRGSKRIGAS